LVSSGFFCRNDPDAAFLGLANFSFKFSKSLFCINTSPLISISSGKSVDSIFFGISFMVERLTVISSPSFPSPLDSPILKLHHFCISMKLIYHQSLALHYMKD
jgi:hypothetical protein